MIPSRRWGLSRHLRFLVDLNFVVVRFLWAFLLLALRLVILVVLLQRVVGPRLLPLLGTLRLVVTGRLLIILVVITLTVTILMPIHLVTILMPTHLVTILMPIHLVTILMTTHLVTILMTTHLVTILITTHLVTILMTTHLVTILITTHLVTILMTTHLVINLVHLVRIHLVPIPIREEERVEDYLDLVPLNHQLLVQEEFHLQVKVHNLHLVFILVNYYS